MLLLVLIPVGILMVTIYVVWDAIQNGMSQHWFTAGVLAVLSVLCAIGFYWDVISYRLHLNKLRIFKPSDSRKIIRK